MRSAAGNLACAVMAANKPPPTSFSSTLTLSSFMCCARIRLAWWVAASARLASDGSASAPSRKATAAAMASRCSFCRRCLFVSSLLRFKAPACGSAFGAAFTLLLPLSCSGALRFPKRGGRGGHEAAWRRQPYSV